MAGIARNILILLTFSFAGCATLGSSASTHDKEALRTITSVYIAPISSNLYAVCDTYSSLRYTCDTFSYSSLTVFLKKRLDSLNLFGRVLLDSTINHQRDSARTPIKEDEAVRQAATLPADAVLFSVIHYTVKPGPTVEVNVTMKLIQTNSGNLIVESSHGTFWGNSYWVDPGTNITTIDSFNGAIDAFQQEVRKSMRSP